MNNVAGSKGVGEAVRVVMEAQRQEVLRLTATSMCGSIPNIIRH